MKNFIIFLGIIFTLINCKKDEDVIVLDEKFDIRLHEQVLLKSENLTIEVTDIEDNRCPEQAMCISAGEGLIDLSVNESNIIVSTSQMLDTLGYKFSCNLSPYPSLDTDLLIEDYIVELTISK